MEGILGAPTRDRFDDATQPSFLLRLYWQTHQSNIAARRLYDSVAENEGFIAYSHDVK